VFVKFSRLKEVDQTHNYWNDTYDGTYDIVVHQNHHQSSHLFRYIAMT